MGVILQSPWSIDDLTRPRFLQIASTLEESMEEGEKAEIAADVTDSYLAKHYPVIGVYDRFTTFTFLNEIPFVRNMKRLVNTIRGIVDGNYRREEIELWQRDDYMIPVFFIKALDDSGFFERLCPVPYQDVFSQLVPCDGYNKDMIDAVRDAFSAYNKRKEAYAAFASNR